MKRRFQPVSVIFYVNCLIVMLLTVYFLFIPGLFLTLNISDPSIRNGGIPREVWRVHKYLTPKYGEWARERIASGKAGKINYMNVPATEWPLFGSVFYLWATENLQKAWEKDRSLSSEAPSKYAKDTIEACKDLLLDPVHHSWVRTHWGDDYMHEQNVFFRSLIIAGLTSYGKLTGSGEYNPLLQDQVDTLSAELDSSPHGVLYDYPDECYPIDVFAAVAWIKRADDFLGTDHSAFIKRERRAFTGKNLDSHGLIPWTVNPVTGEQYVPSRGITNSHILIFAHEIYPDLDGKWYELYEKYFWQDTWLASGWREFYRGSKHGDWTFDVDSGPIMDGFSPSASAFGIATARVNGRLDQAYTLAAQAFAVCWPLPDGQLLGPRLLSDQLNAPYLGEAAVLWQLTETPHKNAEIVKGGHLTTLVYLAFAFYFGFSMLIFISMYFRIRRFIMNPVAEYKWIDVQLAVWIALLLMLTVFLFIYFSVMASIILLLLSRRLPLFKIKKDQKAVIEEHV